MLFLIHQNKHCIRNKPALLIPSLLIHPIQYYSYTLPNGPDHIHSPHSFTVKKKNKKKLTNSHTMELVACHLFSVLNSA